MAPGALEALWPLTMHRDRGPKAVACWWASQWAQTIEVSTSAITCSITQASCVAVAAKSSKEGTSSRERSQEGGSVGPI